MKSMYRKQIANVISLNASWMMAGLLACVAHALAADSAVPDSAKTVKPIPYKTADLLNPAGRYTYEGAYLDQIRFPLGGIGSGCISLNGRGALVDWSIFGNPNLGWRPELSFLGLWAKTGNDEPVFRVLEGEQPPPYGWGGEAQGTGPLAMVGMPHMRTAVFEGRFPFAKVTLKDPDMPLEVTIEGWSPFIPGNDRESSLPVACLNLTFKNVSGKAVKGTLGYNLKNLAAEGTNGGVVTELLRRNGYDLLLMRRDSGAKEGSLAVATPRRITTWEKLWTPSGMSGNGGIQHIAETFCINGHYDIVKTAAEIDRSKTNATRPDVVIDDFESGTYDKWTIEGEAFGRAPVAIEEQQHPSAVTGYQGKRLADSWISAKSDGATGKLTSKPFTIDRAKLSFLIGGGKHPGETCINLLVDKKVVRTATGDDLEALMPASWDVAEFAGKTAQLEIVDRSSGGWGHLMIDNIIMTDRNEDETWPGGMGSIGMEVNLEPGASTSIPLVLSWYFPERKDVPGVRNYYSTQWADAAAVTDYLMANRERLERETRLFQETFFASTLPGVILESVSSQMAILRSPTVFREANGTLHGWEGCWPGGGSCEGTVTHVYHYVQSIAYIFPALERAMREFDFSKRVDPETGGLRNRVWPTKVGEAGVSADGHFGTILRLCREWQINGDTEWLRKQWPGAKKTIEYPWASWDKDRDGRLDPNIGWGSTLDQALYGDETYGNSMYMAALLAGEKMARAMGDVELAKECRRVFEVGSKKTDELCWNGEYYRQIFEGKNTNNTWLNGVVSEQLIGQWWSDMLGLGDIYPRERMRSAIGAVFKYNFVPDCRNLLNTGYTLAVNDDAGLVICSWPNGGRPPQGLFYADTIEVGYEDQVAANLIYHGYVLEGIAVMKAIRDRYDGRKRDPYCQLECGGYYARSMANYSLILALAGYRYSAVDDSLELAPKVNAGDFKCFFGADSGWGLVSQKRTGNTQRNEVNVRRGALKLKSFICRLPAGGADKKYNSVVSYDGAPVPHNLVVRDGKAVITLGNNITVGTGKTLVFNIE
jgi:uncharacterized protein (DUF608 family)